MRAHEFTNITSNVSEEQVVTEIRMDTASLRTQAAATGALAGMEFEMILPEEYHTGDFDVEPDLSMNERSSVDNMLEFFFLSVDGSNIRRDVVWAKEEIIAEFLESDWLAELKREEWDNSAATVIENYVRDNLGDELMDTAKGQSSEPEEVDRIYEMLITSAVENSIVNVDDSYSDAYEIWSSDDWDDSHHLDGWLERFYPTMLDIASNFRLDWPYYMSRNATFDMSDIASEFSRMIGREVNYSNTYHGARRQPGKYVVEPDGSLTGDEDGHSGLEFVSPPLPIADMIGDLNKVRQWAGMRGAYTNKSTGLHINISIPNYDQSKLDYVKLALLIGDEYVLSLFGRSANMYTKSAAQIIHKSLQQKPELAPAVMDKMRAKLEQDATKIIHNGITDKFTSINTKDGYIEFRSPGGDWLDRNFDNIENTLLRFTVALAAAIDPAAYRQEYLKKLYAMLQGSQDTGELNVIALFSNYSAGILDKATLIKQVRRKQTARDAAATQATKSTEPQKPTDLPNSQAR